MLGEEAEKRQQITAEEKEINMVTKQDQCRESVEQQRDVLIATKVAVGELQAVRVSVVAK